MILRVPVTFSNIAEWVRKAAVAINALIEGRRGPMQYVDDPNNPQPGDLYYNTTTGKLRLWASGTWTDLN